MVNVSIDGHMMFKSVKIKRGKINKRYEDQDSIMIRYPMRPAIVGNAVCVRISYILPRSLFNLFMIQVVLQQVVKCYALHPVYICLSLLSTYTKHLYNNTRILQNFEMQTQSCKLFFLSIAIKMEKLSKCLWTVLQTL